MSHRQKNKHKSRHRIHANNGPRIPQLGRVAPGQVKSATAGTVIVPNEINPIAGATVVSVPIV